MELGLLLYLWEGMAAVLPNAAIPVTEKTPSGGLPCPKQSIKTASGDCVWPPQGRGDVRVYTYLLVPTIAG